MDARTRNRAHTNAHWITLTTNFTRTTYDPYSQFWRGYPICMLFFITWVCVVWGSGETKKGSTLTPPRMKLRPMLSTFAGLPDILASKLSYDACASILQIWQNTKLHLSVTERCARKTFEHYFSIFH